jgi:hypothetical protein
MLSALKVGQTITVMAGQGGYLLRIWSDSEIKQEIARIAEKSPSPIERFSHVNPKIAAIFGDHIVLAYPGQEWMIASRAVVSIKVSKDGKG